MNQPLKQEYVVRDYDINDFQDAVKLARLFDSFDSIWPGGFNNGVVQSPHTLFDAMNKMERLAISVVQFEDELVGYCDLHSQADDTDMAYIPLLGADPAHLGKGVGKRLLLEMIRRVTERGFRELTLNTWAGNMLAVPLYKKTGFFWEPDTDVHMRNFLPGLLNSTVGKAFFKDKDWYSCLERDLATEPDDTKWKGMQIFPYTFRSNSDTGGSEYLKAVFEMASGGMTALETDTFSINCSIPLVDSEAPAGEALPISWQIIPKEDHPIDLTLLTDADDGLAIDVREQLQVSSETELERNFKVMQDANPKHHGERQRCVRSTLLMNGLPIVLETGVKAVRPIEIEYISKAMFPGKGDQARVTLKSQLDRDVTGTLSLDSHPGISGSGVKVKFTLPSRMAVDCSFPVTALSTGVSYSRLRIEADGGVVRGSRPIAFRAVSSITPIISVDRDYDEQIIQESAGVKITHALRGGLLRIEQRSSGNELQLPMAEPGPPYASFRRRKQVMNGHTETTDAGSAIVIRAEYPEFPGLALERRVIQVAGDLFRIDYRMINSADTEYKVGLRQPIRNSGVNELTVPLESGILHEPQMDWEPFRVGMGDTIKTPKSLTESWYSTHSNGSISGMIWMGEVELDISWGMSITFDPRVVSAGTSVNLSPIYVVLGSGTWETTRSWWKKLIQPAEDKLSPHPSPQRVFQIKTDPSPLLLTGDGPNFPVDVTVTNERGKPLSGDLNLEQGEITAEPRSVTVNGADRDNSLKFSMSVADRPGFGAGYLRGQLKTDIYSRGFKLPVIRASSPGLVSIEQISAETAEQQYRIRNGIFTYTVTPGFLGSVTSIETDDLNHLYSAYPQSRPFVWANPWFGGIHPYLGWMGTDELTRDKFTGSVAAVTGDRGLEWKGVRVTSSPLHKNLRWLSVEVLYLTLPASDLMAIVTRWQNKSAARQSLNGGIAAWAAPGGNTLKSVGYWMDSDELRHHRRGAFPMEVLRKDWIAVENEESGHRLQIVASGRDANAGLEDFAADGAHMHVQQKVVLEPNETREFMSWLVVNPAISELQAYAELHSIDKLP